MDKSIGQDVASGASGRGPGSRATREKLMAAAAELIAEVGWGRVTTRAVAERAGLPHGAVSYHFRGKQELLSEACMSVFTGVVSLEAFEALSGLEELVALIETELRHAISDNPQLAELMFEAMRESGRDEALRERMRGILADYRGVIVRLVRSEQERGATVDGVSAPGVATLLAAVGDGLLLHALLDDELDVAEALAALRGLLAAR